MAIINWDKPKKILSTEEHNNYYSSDSGVAGTYVSNMSDEDKMKWKGKKFIKTDMPRIELRKTFMTTGYAQVLVIVSMNEPRFTISTNGKIQMSYGEMEEFKAVIDEAYQILVNETNKK